MLKILTSFTELFLDFLKMILAHVCLSSSVQQETTFLDSSGLV